MRTADTHSGIAELSAERIAVELSAESDPLLTVHYVLRSAQSGDRRPLLLDFGECPLWPVSIEGSEIESITYDERSNTVLERVSLHPRASTSWKENAEITIRLRWRQIAPHPALLGTSHLYLPPDLPRIGRRDAVRTGISAQPVVTIRGADRFLAGALSYSLGSPFDDHAPLLRALLTRSSFLAIEADPRGVQLRLLKNSGDSLSISNQKRMYSTIHQMTHFLGDELRVNPGLRIMVDLDSTRTTRSVAGPILAQSLKRFRLQKLDQSTNEFPIARAIAGNWWGAGVRIEGALGIHLFNGIAFALGLAWAQSYALKGSFDALLEYYRERMVTTPRFRQVEYRPGERSIGIGMVLYEALIQEPSLWTSLSELTREFWGQYVPEELVLARLEKDGVSRRDFARKHFCRTDVE